MYSEKSAFFDAHADMPWADDEYGVEEKNKIGRMLDLLPNLRGAAVLEPGCGTGRLTLELANVAGPDGTVVALDISSRMVDAARQRLSGYANVQVRMAELETCSFSEQVFDVIICHQVLPHFNDIPLALARIAKLLRASGMLVVSHFIGREEINDVHRKAGTAVEHDLLPEDAEMKSLLEAAGFKVLTLEDAPEYYLLSAQLHN